MTELDRLQGLQFKYEKEHRKLMEKFKKQAQLLGDKQMKEVAQLYAKYQALVKEVK